MRGITLKRTLWRRATVLTIREETPQAKTFRFALDQPSQHLPGQHHVVRLTAPDGYTASRSYSVASAPDGSAEFELTVERLDGGEVSTFLHDVVVLENEWTVAALLSTLPSTEREMLRLRFEPLPDEGALHTILDQIRALGLTVLRFRRHGPEYDRLEP